MSISSAPTIDEIISTTIRKRRSIFADSFIKKDIPQVIIEEILTNAIWAPTHKMTEPWRFIVLRGQEIEKFGIYMADYYKATLPADQYSPSDYQRSLTYPLNAACLVVIVMSRNERIPIPEWEEIAAVACAVQNIWLSCTAKGIGGYWDTCRACINYGSELELDSSEKCLGFFYMGYYDKKNTSSNKRRSPLSKKVSWLGE